MEEKQLVNFAFFINSQSFFMDVIVTHLKDVCLEMTLLKFLTGNTEPVNLTVRGVQ